MTFIIRLFDGYQRNCKPIGVGCVFYCKGTGSAIFYRSIILLTSKLFYGDSVHGDGSFIPEYFRLILNKIANESIGNFRWR
jgi:hypothetical protein